MRGRVNIDQLRKRTKIIVYATKRKQLGSASDDNEHEMIAAMIMVEGLLLLQHQSSIIVDDNPIGVACPLNMASHGRVTAHHRIRLAAGCQPGGVHRGDRVEKVPGLIPRSIPTAEELQRLSRCWVCLVLNRPWKVHGGESNIPHGAQITGCHRGIGRLNVVPIWRVHSHPSFQVDMVIAHTMTASTIRDIAGAPATRHSIISRYTSTAWILTLEFAKQDSYRSQMMEVQWISWCENSNSGTYIYIYNANIYVNILFLKRRGLSHEGSPFVTMG